MSKITVGLDIGFSSIKAVALAKEKTAKLISLGSIPSPVPGMVSDADPDLQNVATAIKKLLDATKIEEKEVIEGHGRTVADFAKLQNPIIKDGTVHRYREEAPKFGPK